MNLWRRFIAWYRSRNRTDECGLCGRVRPVRKLVRITETFDDDKSLMAEVGGIGGTCVMAYFCPDHVPEDL